MLQISCDLGGFPILQVKTGEGDLGEGRDLLVQLHRLQRVLVKENKNYNRKSIIHILAESQTLDQNQQSLLKYFLDSGSFQRINLFQRDEDFKLPIVLAIENGNIEFIKIICKSEASLKMKWQDFFDLKSISLAKAVDKLFRPIR